MTDRSMKIKKDAPMRRRAVECLRINGRPDLASELADAETSKEMLATMNKASRDTVLRRSLTSAKMVGSFLVLEFSDGYGLRFIPSQVASAEPDAWAHFVICRSCAAQGPWFKTPGNATRMWNTRKREELLVKERDAAEGELDRHVSGLRSLEASLGTVYHDEAVEEPALLDDVSRKVLDLISRIRRDRRSSSSRRGPEGEIEDHRPAEDGP